MPLFTNHKTMQIDARRVRCPEPDYPHFLPASRECQHGQNRGKWYTVSYNESHGHRFKFWDLGAFAASPVATSSHPEQYSPCRPPLFQASASCQNTKRQDLLSRAVEFLCSVHELAPPARMISKTTQQLLVAGLEEAAAALPAPRHCVSELHHQRLAQEQEAGTAACLAALTALPPSPMLSQEARDQVFTVSVALGTSPPPLVVSQPTRRVTLITINGNLFEFNLILFHLYGGLLSTDMPTTKGERHRRHIKPAVLPKKNGGSVFPRKEVERRRNFCNFCNAALNIL
ncbi:hypothetical protein B0H14DRAFT_2593752 [Mycena olivaceomarginata]|nr:hypothetical protein B0H14DRAFT_2593752 [Mycena olivaceomarginata]